MSTQLASAAGAGPRHHARNHVLQHAVGFDSYPLHGDGMCIALMRTTDQAHMEEETVVVMGTSRALGAHTQGKLPSR
jgi:hypothetical protein